MSRLWPVLILLAVCFTVPTACPRASAADPPPKDVWEKYLYPNREGSAPGSQTGDMHSLVLSTADDFDKVIAWYEKATGQSLAVKELGSVSTNTAGVAVQDLSTPQAKLRILVMHNPSSSFTLVVSRAKDEKVTRVAMTYWKR